MTANKKTIEYKSEDGVSGYVEGDTLHCTTTGERHRVMRDGRGLTLSPVKQAEPFVLDSTVYGQARVGTLQAAPADIVRAFGPANVGASGDNKVDREWCFRSREGHGVSVYAYKATSLYCSDDETPSPSEFWAQDVPRDLSVGGPNEHVGEAFIAWAQAKIAEVGGK